MECSKCSNAPPFVRHLPDQGQGDGGRPLQVTEGGDEHEEAPAPGHSSLHAQGAGGGQASNLQPGEVPQGVLGQVSIPPSDPGDIKLYLSREAGGKGVKVIIPGHGLRAGCVLTAQRGSVIRVSRSRQAAGRIPEPEDLLRDGLPLHGHHRVMGQGGAHVRAP